MAMMPVNMLDRKSRVAGKRQQPAGDDDIDRLLGTVTPSVSEHLLESWAIIVALVANYTSLPP